MYIGLYPYTTCFKLFKYHVFVFGCVLDKTIFQFKNQSFRKYSFWFSAKFVRHKNGSNSLKYVLKFFHTCLYIKENIRNYFCGFLEFLWDFIGK